MGGVGEQKPGLAASTTLREPGLGPRDEGSSGDVEKPHLPPLRGSSGLEA